MNNSNLDGQLTQQPLNKDDEVERGNLICHLFIRIWKVLLISAQGLNSEHILLIGQNLVKTEHESSDIV